MTRAAPLLAAVLLLGACSAPWMSSPDLPVTDDQGTVDQNAAQDNADPPAPQGAAGGAEAETSLGPSKLTGVRGIDQSQELSARIIDARGTGRLGGVPIAAGSNSALTVGQWMLTDAGSEYEITVQSALVPDGIVRLDSAAAFYIAPGSAAAPTEFRVYGGRASFYVPHVALDLVVDTPAGPLVTRGGVFTVTVAPDFQVLVTCRQGAVYLTGTQNAAAVPGQVLIADTLGRSRTYAMTPNEALTFTDHWLKIAGEEAAAVLKVSLPLRVAEWSRADVRGDAERARVLAFWFRSARGVLGDRVPAPDVWQDALTAPSGGDWTPTPAPGLLGELP